DLACLSRGAGPVAPAPGLSEPRRLEFRSCCHGPSPSRTARTRPVMVEYRPRPAPVMPPERPRQSGAFSSTTLCRGKNGPGEVDHGKPAGVDPNLQASVDLAAILPPGCRDVV